MKMEWQSLTIRWTHTLWAEWLRLCNTQTSHALRNQLEEEWASKNTEKFLEKLAKLNISAPAMRRKADFKKEFRVSSMWIKNRLLNGEFLAPFGREDKKLAQEGKKNNKKQLSRSYFNLPATQINDMRDAPLGSDSKRGEWSNDKQGGDQRQKTTSGSKSNWKRLRW